MRSHFTLPPTLTAACAVASAASLLSSHCSGGTFIAADYATNPAYAGGWTNGQNAGYGFGAWSFDATDATPPGQYQGIGSSSPLGTAWTLLTYSGGQNGTGLANAGRAIPGGLQPGQTFETLLQNPSTWQGMYSYRGFDLLFTAGTNNDVGGDNTSALRAQVFDYFNPSQYWAITDRDSTTHLNGSAAPAFTGPLTAAAGMKLDFTLVSTNTYSLTLTPLSDPTMAYTQTGNLDPSGLPISWVNFRLYCGASSGLSDTNNNYSISSMTIAPLTLNIQSAGTNVLLSWPGALANNYALLSTTNLTPSAWSAVSTNASGIVNGQFVVTNPITGSQQFYRLQLQQ